MKTKKNSWLRRRRRQHKRHAESSDSVACAHKASASIVAVCWITFCVTFRFTRFYLLFFSSSTLSYLIFRFFSVSVFVFVWPLLHSLCKQNEEKFLSIDLRIRFAFVLMSICSLQNYFLRVENVVFFFFLLLLLVFTISSGNGMHIMIGSRVCVH